MKKTFWVAMILLAPFTASFAQIETSGGVKFGINAATIGADGKDDGAGYLAALHAGFYFEVKPAKRIGIQPEVLYSRQGAKITYLKFNYDYVVVPLMVNVYPTDKFYLQAGPQFGYLVAAKVTDGKNTLDVKDQVNTTDMAGAVGLGYKFGVVSISARYNFSFTSTTKVDNPVTGLKTTEHFPNRVFQVSLGLRLK